MGVSAPSLQRESTDSLIYNHTCDGLYHILSASRIRHQSDTHFEGITVYNQTKPYQG